MPVEGKRKRWNSKAWTSAEIKLLGTKPDSVLARRLGRTIKDVVEQRESHRIGLPTPPRRWTAREINLLGKLNDHELSLRLRRPKQEVRQQRVALKIPSLKPRGGFRVWKPDENKLLGTMTDAQAAQKLGRMGTMPDAELAKRLNRTFLSAYRPAASCLE